MYQCYCHVGKCPLHDQDNRGRKEFMKFVEEFFSVTETDGYGAINRRKARTILHRADAYVHDVLNSNQNATYR